MIKKEIFHKPANLRETYYKNQLYIKYLTNTFSILDKFIKLDGFISFNIFNYTEKYLEEVFKNLDKKFIILHKEFIFTPIEEITQEFIKDITLSL